MLEPFGVAEAAAWIAVPGPGDDKYSRGVVGFVTGSTEYPGAAVLGVEAALHTGVGMVRHLAPASVSRLVLTRRPEAVTAPGRAQAWVIGSGQPEVRDAETAERIDAALEHPAALVLDAGALDLHARATRGAALTPHEGELARLLRVTRDEVRADRVGAARRAARETGAVVLLKGAETIAVAPDGAGFSVSGAPAWLATAGAGDALAGVLGALVATRAASGDAAPDLAPLAATAAVLHGRAAQLAARGGPFTILELCGRLSDAVRELVGGDPAPGRLEP